VVSRATWRDHRGGERQAASASARGTGLAEWALVVRYDAKKGTTMRKKKQWGAIIGLSMLLGGCAMDELAEPGANEEQEPDQVVPLVVIGDEEAWVEWLAPELPGEEPEIVISARGLAAPLIPPDMVEGIGAVQSYLALVDEDEPLHPALVPFVRADDEPVIASRALRQALRAETLEVRHQIALANAEAAAEEGSDLILYSGGCTNAQRAAAKNFYGAAYSAGGGSAGSLTCGQNISNAHSVDGKTYYCNIPNSNCDYELGGGTECDANKCTTVRGRTRALRARREVGPSGNFWFAHYGQRYRFGFRNCSGTYSAVMRRKRGNGDWIYSTIPAGTMTVRVGGGAFPPPHALARYVVKWGLWKEAHNWGTSATPLNRMEMTAQTEGLACGDIIQRFDTFDDTASWCNGGKSLCEPGGSCKGTLHEHGCWK
jgi:hypothetical protein